MLEQFKNPLVQALVLSFFQTVILQAFRKYLENKVSSKILFFFKDYIFPIVNIGVAYGSTYIIKFHDNFWFNFLGYIAVNYLMFNIFYKLIIKKIKDIIIKKELK